jgi:hypothetical protein
MTRIKTEISNDQNRHAHPFSDLDAFVRSVVTHTLANLEHHTLPARQRALRREAASRYVGVDAATLQDWAGEKPPKGPAFRRLGGRVIYLIEELDEYLDALPRNTPRNASRAVSDVE